MAGAISLEERHRADREKETKKQKRNRFLGPEKEWDGGLLGKGLEPEKGRD